MENILLNFFLERKVNWPMQEFIILYLEMIDSFHDFMPEVQKNPTTQDFLGAGGKQIISPLREILR